MSIDKEKLEQPLTDKQKLICQSLSTFFLMACRKEFSHLTPYELAVQLNQIFDAFIQDNPQNELQIVTVRNRVIESFHAIKHIK